MVVLTCLNPVALPPIDLSDLFYLHERDGQMPLIMATTFCLQRHTTKCVCLQFLVHPTNLPFDFDIPGFSVLMVGTLEFEIKFVEMNAAVLIVFNIRNEFLIHSLLLMPSSAQALC